jgi:hypothetical protein
LSSGGIPLFERHSLTAATYLKAQTRRGRREVFEKLASRWDAGLGRRDGDHEILKHKQHWDFFAACVLGSRDHRPREARPNGSDALGGLDSEDVQVRDSSSVNVGRISCDYISVFLCDLDE